MKLGIVCGLKSEAAVLESLPNMLVGVSGARPDKAEAEALRLASGGADVLVSFGLAGGLDPARTPGDLLIPSEIVDETGARHAVDAALAAKLGLDCEAGGAPILGSETIVDSAARKAELFSAFAAAAVDMESHRVARAAAAAGRPVVVVRAVADPADRALPPSAMNAVDESGGVRTLATIAGLIRRPMDLPALLSLKGDSDAGLATLKRAAAALTAYASAAAD